MVLFRNPGEATRAAMYEMAGLQPEELREVEGIIDQQEPGDAARARLLALAGTDDVDCVRHAHQYLTTKRRGGRRHRAPK